MAKKNVVIFDGEDKFINPKKAVYSKARGKSKTFESFKSLRAATMDEEGSVEPVQSISEQNLSQGSTPMAEQVMTNETIGAAPQYTEPIRTPIGNVSIPSLPEVVVPPIFAPSVEDRKSINPVYEAPEQPIFQAVTREPVYTAPEPQLPVTPRLDDDRKSINPVYEAPVQSVFQPITREEPPYVAPVPQLPVTPRLDDDRRSTMPVYEAPVQARFQPITEEPTISAPPVKTLPTRPTPPRDIMFPDDGSGYRGGKPVLDDRLPSDGIPQGAPILTPSPYQPNPIFTAPVPALPVTTPPAPPAKIIADPMGGGGSPVMGGPEIPRPKCPTGFVYNETTGMCIDKRNPDTEIDPFPYVGGGSGAPANLKDPCTFPPSTPLVANHEWKKTGDCTWEQKPIISTSTTNTTTTKSTSTTTSTTTLTTTKAAVVDKTCNPPIYAAPKYYKWVSKGNCAYELVVDDTQLKDAAPAPVLPAAGQPIINLTLPTGGLGTLPTTSTSTTVQTTTLKPLATGGDSGGSGGGGGGSPFPEEPAPTGPAPKKNYFWWYVGGALAIYLILKRKKSQ